MSPIDEIRDFLASRFEAAREAPIAPDDDLLRQGVLDSIAIMEIVGFLELTYGVSVDADDVTVDNFHSLSAISGLVERKLDGGR